MIKKFISNLAIIMVFTVSCMGFSSSASADDSAMLKKHANEEVIINCYGTGMVLGGAK